MYVFNSKTTTFNIYRISVKFTGHLDNHFMMHLLATRHVDIYLLMTLIFQYSSIRLYIDAAIPRGRHLSLSTRINQGSGGGKPAGELPMQTIER